MIYCSQCGAENPGDGRYCSACGADLPRGGASRSASADLGATRIEQEPQGDELLPGMFVDRGRYQIDALLGTGGMGAVYRAQDLKLEVTVALKVIHSDLLGGTAGVERLRKEVRISRDLQHVGIVRVYDLGSEQGREFYTMEYVQGPTLREAMEERGEPFSLDQTRQVLLPFLDALGYAHERGVVHRDVKPENVLLAGGDPGKPKLMDFGIARALEADAFTRTSVALGTPEYVAPEQMRDAAHVDGRADLYSVGVILYELLTGERPALRCKLPAELRPELPGAVDELVDRLLQPRPERRPATAAEVRRALEGIGAEAIAPPVAPVQPVQVTKERPDVEPAGGPGPAKPVEAPPASRVGRQKGRRSGAWLAFLLVLAGAAIGGVFWQQQQKAEQARVAAQRTRAEAGRSELVVQSTPVAGRVWIDGKLVGKAGLQRHSVKHGAHIVRVEVAGYHPYVNEVQVDRSAVVEAILKPAVDCASFDDPVTHKACVLFYKGEVLDAAKYVDQIMQRDNGCFAGSSSSAEGRNCLGLTGAVSEASKDPARQEDWTTVAGVLVQETPKESRSGMAICGNSCGFLVIETLEETPRRIFLFIYSSTIRYGTCPNIGAHLRISYKPESDNPRTGEAKRVECLEIQPEAEQARVAAQRTRAEAGRREATRGEAERIATARAVDAAKREATRAAESKSGDMVQVPAGEFWYGCNGEVDSQCDSDEKLGKKVDLDEFWIDRTEVTVGAYGKCVRAGRCSEPDTGKYCNWGKTGRTQHPINCVDWGQAKTYCAWAGKRLPAEQEWEKAARGTDGRKYPWGNNEASCHYAVISDGGWGCGRGSTWPVGSKATGASPYGAQDMAGNALEWTASSYGSEQKYRVVRGGSWFGVARYARASSRFRYDPGFRSSLLGFRCAR